VSIAVSVTTPKPEASFESRFGRAAVFVIVDTNTGEQQTIANPAVQSRGGAGIRAAEFPVRQDVEAVISGALGPNAYDVLQASGVRLYQAKSGTVDDLVARLLKGDLDAPPGTSCPVVEAVSGAGYVILVTEQTSFGLYDLKLAYELTCELGLPAGVIINRDGIGNRGVDDFCLHVGLPVLLRIPMERAIAAGIAQGMPLVSLQPEYNALFKELYLIVAGVSP
jgi:predicted Fe-Mo cluster-binding NifX family protein